MALGSLSAGAAVVHFVVAPEHFGEDVRFGLFFVIVATLQLAWGAAIIAGDSKALYVGGAGGNALVLAVWVASRTTGLPFGPHAGLPDPIGLLDGLASGYEAALVAGSLYALGRAGAVLPPRSTPLTPSLGSAVLVYVLPAAAFMAGGGGHGPTVDPHFLAHHLLHVAFIGGASVVFCLYVMFLVLENGWPTFSWRLRPDAPDAR